jgi:DinB superfamily
MDDVIAAVRDVLSTTPARWQTLVGTLPAELLTRPPAAGEWSAVECLRHLLDTEAYVFPVRVQAFLEGRDLAAFDPDTQGTRDGEQSLVQMVAELAHRRTASLAVLTELTADDLARTARHSELGEVTLGQMLNEWAAHDLMHTVQAERALMQPFITACGPWRDNFLDHDVAAKG